MAAILRAAALAQLDAQIAARRRRDEDDARAGVPAGSTPGGDTRRLRGIPAIGRGVAGAIPGSAPHRDLQP